MPETPRQLRILAFCMGNVDRPDSGGQLRFHHLYRELSERGHHVELHSLVARNHPTRDIWINERFHIVLHHSSWLDVALLFDRLGVRPITELPCWMKPLKSWVGNLASAESYDIVQFEMPWFANLQSAARAPGRAIAYGSQNIEWRWWRGRLRRLPFWKFWRARLYRNELKAIGGADGAIGCTPTDCRWLKKHSTKTALVPNGYDARTIKPASEDERLALRRQYGWAPDEKVALFIGSETLPNHQALHFIVMKLLPALSQHKIRFVIAGRVSEDLRGGSGPLQNLGVVKDVLPLLQAANVGLNPMRSGGGSNVKLAEYCAAGLGVVTTRFGLRGFEGLEACVRVADLETFAQAVIETDWPEVPPREIIAAYSWQAAAQKLEAFYLQLAGPDKNQSLES